MRRTLLIVVAFAIVAVLVSITVRSRSNGVTPVDDGTWELADEPPAT